MIFRFLTHSYITNFRHEDELTLNKLQSIRKKTTEYLL